MIRFNSRRFTTALVAVAAAAGSVLGVAGTAAAAPVRPTAAHSAATTVPTATPAAAAMEAQFLGLLNAHRVANHDKPLTVSPDLVALSRTWSAKMAGGVGLAHDPNLAQELTNWKTAGQNVGDGTDVVTLDNAFWASPLHKYNELYPAFSQVGIGVVIVNGTVWVTFDFRQPATTVAAPAPVKHAAVKPAVHAKKTVHAKTAKAEHHAKRHHAKKHHHRKHHA